MALLSLSNITKYFGSDLILKDVSLNIENNHKIGFVGANGSGKTTLFKIIANKLKQDEGDIFISKSTKIAYVDQFINANENINIYDDTLSVFNNLIKLEEELDKINHELLENHTEALIKRQEEIINSYKNNGGYTYKNLTRSTLLGLGFTENELSLNLASLSGGQKTKIALAKLLLSDSNLLLLDEPTNNLDIESIEWLENFLMNYKGSFIVISHDRYFLDKVTNETIELENHVLSSYAGNYSKYLELKKEKETAMAKKYSLQQKEIERIEGIIAQQVTWSQERNYKIIRNKQKSIDRIENDMVKPPDELDTIHFKFKTISGGNKEVVVANEISKSFGEKTLLNKASFIVYKKERVFLLGPNGSGKTTILNMVMKEIPLDSGIIDVGGNIKIAYYKQTSNITFSNKNVLEYMWDMYPKLTQTEIRSALAAFLFKGEDVFKNVNDLSGGEKARLSLLNLMLSESNFLILDEPTNHLDIPSREALENALLDYDGTLLIVSHDRFFINKLATKIYYIDNQKLSEFKGNYDFFISNFVKNEIKKESTVSQNALSYKEKKEQETAKRKIENKIKKIESEMEELNNRLNSLNALLETPEYSSDYQKAMEVTSEIEEINTKIASLYEEWEYLIENQI